MNPGAASVVRQSAAVETTHSGHPASWWAQIPKISDRFDAASAAEGLSDLITPKIPSPLLRREAQIAADVVIRHLNKPSSPELAERSATAIERLVATVERLAERHTGDDSGTSEACALCHALAGRWADAAAEAELFVGTQPLLRVFVGALRLQQFDEAETITALDQCAYAELSPAQSKMASRLLNGEQALVDACAKRLEALGETKAAAKLREGDLTAVALAARSLPL